MKYPYECIIKEPLCDTCRAELSELWFMRVFPDTKPACKRCGNMPARMVWRTRNRKGVEKWHKDNGVPME